MILVDTSVWVRSLRRGNSKEKQVLDGLLATDNVATTDLVVAEVLQGARSVDDFRKLEDRFEAPHFFHAGEGTWRTAARLSFDLKRSGLTTALSDLVIATVALENDLDIYAVDTDFDRVPSPESEAL